MCRGRRARGDEGFFGVLPARIGVGAVGRVDGAFCGAGGGGHEDYSARNLGGENLDDEVFDF